MLKKYFGTDGIRGRVNSGNINGDMFFKFGLAAGKYFTNLKKMETELGWVAAFMTKHLNLQQQKRKINSN